MATIQDRPLSVAETKKLKSNAGVPNLNFQLQVDIYQPQMPPSVSPQSLSNDSDKHLMTIDLREEEVPVTSRSRNTSGTSSSSCGSRNVDENLPNLPSNAVDEHTEADVDSEDGLFNGKTATSSGLLRNSDISHPLHMNNDHNVQQTIYECTICDFATNYQQKLADHQRTVHCLNKGRDSGHASHDLMENPSLESEQNHVLDLPHLHSSQENATFVKKEAIDLEDEDGEAPPTDGVSEDGEAPPTDGVSTFLANTNHTLDKTLHKKKKSRQEVDRCKYFQVFHEGNSKYACSECGNFYKWRKSLNKHWREKHHMKQLLKTDNPPGLIKLMKTGKYSLMGSRKLYDIAFLKKIQTTQSDVVSCAASSSTNLSPTSHLLDMLTMSTSLPRTPDLPSPPVTLFASRADSLATVQDAFPAMPMGFLQFPVRSNDYHSPEEGVLDLSCHRKRNFDNCTISGIHHQDRVFPSDQAQPLNVTRGSIYENALQIMCKNEPNSSHPVKELPRCSKSDCPGTSEAVSAGYTHSKKRVVTCEECKLQTQSMGELNNHFIKDHIQKLFDYKEAIRKIPHGLQQVYHLLDMGFDEIVELGNRDLESVHGINLKCKKGDFESQSPADFQKHVMSHTEERPFVCMICGTTYKFKWDLVKHFKKSHTHLPNPYQRNDRKDAGNEDSEEENKPSAKKAKLDLSDVNDSFCNKTTQNNDRSHESETARTQECMSRNDSRVSNSLKTNSTLGKRAMEQGSSDSPRGYTPDNLLWKCPQCARYFHSLSDMEQHMKIHSQEKKFKCSTCDYRSKWKCDVTKHMKRCTGGGIGYVNNTNKSKKPNASVGSRSRNAFVNKKGKGKHNTALSNSVETNGQQLASLKQASPTTYRGDASQSKTSPVTSTTTSMPQRKSSDAISSVAIWQCINCPFTTHNYSEFKRHSCKHGGDKPFKCDQCIYTSNWSGDIKKHRQRHHTLQPSFNCSHCGNYFKTLQELKDHCFKDHFVKESSQNSPLTLEMEYAVDVARIKHPRKRNFHCLQCPFVCNSQHILKNHVRSTFHCLYCKSMFENELSLFDHITKHKEFIPEEWELLFTKADNKNLGKHNSGTMETSPKKAKKSDEVLIKSPKKAKKSDEVLITQKTQFMHTCEWCLEQFMHLTALYNHAISSHTTQLNDQVADKATMDTGSQILPPINDVDVREISCCLPEAMKETGSDRKTCNLSLASSELQVQLNESKVTQCWFCNVREEDLNHLFKHVTVKHLLGWYKSALGPTSTLQDSDSVHKSSRHAMDVSPKNKIFSLKMAHHITCIPKQQYTWNGVPVNVMVIGCALKFACSFCEFTNASILETSRHVFQNHKAIDKFSCQMCNFSHDNEDAMFDHCTAEHQPSERVVEGLDFKQIDHHDLLMLFLDALNESLARGIGKDIQASPCDKSDPLVC